MKIVDFLKRQMAGMMGMVDCNTFAELMYDAIDGEVSEEDLKKVIKHMDGCSPCKGAYELEEAIKLAISNKVNGQKAPAGLADQIKKKVEELC